MTSFNIYVGIVNQLLNIVLDTNMYSEYTTTFLGLYKNFDYLRKFYEFEILSLLLMYITDRIMFFKYNCVLCYKTQ